MDRRHRHERRRGRRRAGARVDRHYGRCPRGGFGGHGARRLHRARRLRRRVRGGVRALDARRGRAPRAGEASRARDRGARASDRVRAERSPGRDAGICRHPLRRPLRRAAPGERAVVFSTNHAGHEAAMALARAGLEIVGDRRPGRGRRGHRRRAGRRHRRAYAERGVRRRRRRPAFSGSRSPDPTARPRPSTPISCWSREGGTPRRSSGAASAAICDGTTTAPPSFPTGMAGRRGSRSSAPRRARFRRASPSGPHRPTTSRSTSWTCSATRPSPTCSTRSATSCARPST